MAVSTNRALTGEQSTAATAAAAPVDAVAATNTLTSNNTQVTANDTVTVNGKVYTFVASPTVEGDVHFVTDADTSLTNLSAAINHTGTPNTDYKCAAAHPTVSSSGPASHVLTLTALIKGTAGNALTLTKSAATLTALSATFAGGIDCLPGSAGDIVIYSGQPYICVADSILSSTGTWKKVTVAAL